MKLLIVFLFFTSVAFSQGKEKVLASEIDSLQFTTYRVTDKERILFDPATEKLDVGDRIQVQITAFLADGRKLTSPLSGKKGLKLRPFKCSARGAYERISSSADNYVELIASCTAPMFQFVVTDNYSTDLNTGEVGVCIDIWHREEESKKFYYFIPVTRPANLPKAVSYGGRDLNVEVFIDSTNQDYPLAIRINCPGKPEKNSFWRINPEVETLTINTNGYSGSNAYYNPSNPSSAKSAGNGKNGGNINIRFIGEAKQYEYNVVLENRGGRGGKPSGYMSAGRDGSEGKINVSYE